ncbi:hypothetical protein EG329_001148 [Mollisiaceae sp. DMI_Dod_QoI]|nr:hypothetical protein EG329_001148 [Helotiales sp. DMI_Dod_QoI]
MAKCRLGILTLLLHIALVSAISWDAAPSTTFDAQTLSTETVSQAPSATPAPSIVINGTTYEPPNLCGYVEYSSANSYTCGDGNTCLWNSNLGLVGCGNPTSVNYFTSCVPWRHIQDCNSSCLADPSILRCSTPTPYCVTPIIGPHHNYSIFGCEATRIYGRYKVHLTYSGQTTTGHLPRYLGDNGVITYGTRIPKNQTSTSTSSSLTQDPFLVETISISVTDTTQPASQTGGNWTGSTCGNGSYCRTGKSRWQEAQIKTEIIAGSVIGGFMFLILAGLLTWIFLAWRRLRREKQKRDSEPKDVRLEDMMRASVVTSDASGSVSRGGDRSRTMSERTMSVSREAVIRERSSMGSPVVPVSPVSEVGSGRMSRGTSTFDVFDEIYDDEDIVRGRRPIIRIVPEEEPMQAEVDQGEAMDGHRQATLERGIVTTEKMRPQSFSEIDHDEDTIQERRLAVPEEIPAQIPAEVPAGMAPEVPVDLRAEVPEGIPAETPAEIPAEISAEIPIEIPVEVQVEAPAGSDVPAETEGDQSAAMEVGLPESETSTTEKSETHAL